MITQHSEVNMEQNQQPQTDKTRAYVHIEQELLGRKDFTPADKLVAARISGFEIFYESPATTAEFLGVSVASVKRARIKLEKLGALIVIKNDGRGKQYAVDYTALAHLPSQIDTPQAKKVKLTHQMSQIDTPGVANCDTENKERSNGEQRSFCDKSQKDASAVESEQINEEQPKRYGNAEVNDALDLWEHETGFNHHSTKSERYAIAGLIKQHGYEPTKALIKRVGIATRSRDRFAPQIAKPSQLRGKYSKLEALIQWERRQDYRDPDQPNLQKLYETPEEYQRPEAEDTTTKEERHANVEAIREQYRGTKYEAIFCRRKAGDK